MGVYQVKLKGKSNKFMKKNKLAKTYEANKVESRIYQKWEKSGFFNPDNALAKKSAKSFSIALPPPNVTGQLHIGHAVMLAIQDIIARYHRMKGDKTLWLPGMDHAAIATQNVVEKKLAQSGKKKEDLGHEKFCQLIDKYVEKSKATIKNQIKCLGSSLDWSRERFTLDKGLSEAVTTAFIQFYDDGLIYRGNRIVNWCPRCQSTLADDEVEYKEQTAPFYYFKYGPVVIGTARPETKFGDKVVIVHPTDKRYKDLINKEFEIEWILGKIKAKVIADPAADPKMGTGAMTITPGHSFVDFELAQKYNIPIEKIIDKDGKLSKAAGALAGLPVKEARKKVVEMLQAKSLVDHIDENYKHNLSVCYRCGTPIEPLVSRQWFVAVDKPTKQLNGKTLKQRALDVIKNKEIEFIPTRFEKTYQHWMENLHDWCISRQLWYGHKIPVWYCYDCHDDPKKYSRGEYYWVVKDKEPKKCPSCGSLNIHQDNDTLDTWFSSGLWTFSTLGWPITKDIGFHDSLVKLVKSGQKTKTFRLRDHGLSAGETCLTHESQTKNNFGYLRIIAANKISFNDIPLRTKGHESYKSLEELKKTFKKYYPDAAINSNTPVWVYEFVYQPDSDLKLFHPTSVMETGYDIIFFWVARMILMSTYLLDEIPFEKVYLHGLVRDKQGRKMSKSLGNGIDPLEMSEKYGADAVRLSLVLGTTPGNDLKLSVEKIAGYRNFSNKLWNIARYVLTQDKPNTAKPEPKTLADNWILSRLNNLIHSVTQNIENFKLSDAGIKTYEFVWHEFADWYIEIHKTAKNDSVLYYVLGQILKLLHPFSPFITEKLWGELGKNNLLIEKWPQVTQKYKQLAAERDFEIIKNTVVNIRNAKHSYSIPPGTLLDYSSSNRVIQNNSGIIESLAKTRYSKTAAKHSLTLASGSVRFQLHLTDDLVKKLLDSKNIEQAKKRFIDKQVYVNKLRSEVTKLEENPKVPMEIIGQKQERLRLTEQELAEVKKVLDNIHHLSHEMES